MAKNEKKDKKKYLNYKKTLLRNFFFRRESIEDEGKSTTEARAVVEGLSYIQMKLPTEKITKEFEQSLKEKISHNILRAKIREATIEDLETVRYIHNRACLTSNTPFSPITLEGIRDVFKISSTKIFIARVYGQDAGFLITDLEGENDEIGVIAGLGILPRFQRRYLGTILGMHSWEYFKKQKIKELKCEVYVDNMASYKLIKGLGFEEYDRITYGTEDFEIPNEKKEN